MKIPYNEIRIFSLIISILCIEFTSFYFNITGGPTAVMSAIVVSQSFIGAQYLKARNRIIGTILGVIVSFISAHLFAGNEIYFLAFSMLWISFMAVMTSLVPTDNSHLFQLGANTYAFVAIPLIEDPGNTYFNLISRSTGVIMGVVILVTISVLLLLKGSDYNIKSSVRNIYRNTLKIRTKIKSSTEIDKSEIKLYFYDVLNIVANKKNVIYEHGLGFKSSTALKTISIMSMMLFLYSNTLRHYIQSGDNSPGRIQKDYLKIIKKALSSRDNFNKFNHHKVKRINIFSEHKSVAEAARRGTRALVITGILLTIWFVTGWSSGHVMVSMGVVYMILLTTYPSPVSGGKYMVYGTVLGMITGWAFIQSIYSSSYTFTSPSLFFIAQLPVLIFGSRWLFVGKTFLLGVTFLTTFYFGVQPSNLTVVSYHIFMENCLGATAGLIITGLGISIILPERKFTTNEHLIKITMQDVIHSLSTKELNISKVVKHMHDRLRLSDSLKKFTSDDFIFLTNLSSLYIIIHYIIEENESNIITDIVLKQLNQWLETNEIMIENETKMRLENLIDSEEGEIKKLSICAYNILKEMKEIYEN
ncbi:FUSC family protein [Pectobacterium versatile]|uniref:FUSC family protein n=1 Tax=Pectobacterium versatile TaxID=2488639 RepID=UPI0032EE1160